MMALAYTDAFCFAEILRQMVRDTCCVGGCQPPLETLEETWPEHPWRQWLSETEEQA